MPKFSNRSKSRLDTCHPDLIKLFNEVIKHVDCSILEGYRGEARQNILFEAGKSKAKFPKSKHNSDPSRATDVMPYPIDWDNLARINHFAGIVKGIAIGMDINIKWGGDFKSFFDGPHFELVD
jgi:hypothetical protein